MDVEKHLESESGEPAPPPLAPPRQFTLRRMFLIVFLIALVLGYVELSRRMLAQQRELVQLRKEVGYFAIDDPTKVHVVSVPMQEGGCWKWKIYLPPGAEWYVRCAISAVPKSGYTTQNIDDARLIGVSHLDKRGGEFTLQTFIAHDIDGRRQFSLRTADSLGGEQTSGRFLSGKQAHEWFDSGVSSQNLTGDKGMVQIAPADRIELLRMRVSQIATVPSPLDGNKPLPGILIWLEKKP